MPVLIKTSLNVIVHVIVIARLLILCQEVFLAIISQQCKSSAKMAQFRGRKSSSLDNPDSVGLGGWWNKYAFYAERSPLSASYDYIPQHESAHDADYTSYSC